MSTPVSLEDRGKDRKPKDTQFKQQKLPAWQPIMTAGTVLPAFFALGIAFIPLGVALLLTSNSVNEVFKDYTYDCALDAAHHPSTNMSCVDWLKQNNGSTCHCSITLELETEFKGQVYVYYGLTNYYQNHRRYVKSRDDDQLKGKAMTGSTLTDDCKPYKTNDTDEVFMYAPCGAIANSLFNDTFTLMYNGEQGTDTPIEVGLNANGIAWQTDVDSKFANPANWDNTVHPPNWHKDVSELVDPNDPTNAARAGYKNEDLIVWMRTAALPTFRKLYRLVKLEGDTFNEGLPKGNYTVAIEYNYPVHEFEGRKRIILTTTSWMGGKNPFLGIAYLVVGSICIVLGIVFLIIHIRVGKNPSEMSATVNSNSPY